MDNIYENQYNLGDKFVIEISSVIRKSDGTYAYGVKKVKDYCFDEKVLERLEKVGKDK